jgi:flagellar hook assembly protein FlgD
VLVTFDTNVVGTGEYHAQIVVSGEDVEAVSVPVTLIAGDASAVTDRGERPGRLALETARPNPSAGMSAVMLALPNEARVELGVYDASGRRVRTLLSGTLSAGYHPQVWDGRDDGGRSLPTGLYLYKLNAAGQRLSQKVMLLR